MEAWCGPFTFSLELCLHAGRGAWGELMVNISCVSPALQGCREDEPSGTSLLLGFFFFEYFTCNQICAHECWELNLGPLQEWSMLLTAE